MSDLTERVAKLICCPDGCTGGKTDERLPQWKDIPMPCSCLNFRAEARAAIALVIEEAAKVAEFAYHQECCGRGYHNCCGEPVVYPMQPEEIAAAIRALKEPT